MKFEDFYRTLDYTASSLLLLTFGAALLLSGIILILRKPLKEIPKFIKANKREIFLGFCNGFMELILYIFVILISYPEFIAFWMAVKTALMWFRKSEISTLKSENELNKITYLSFLIGNGLVLLFAYMISCFAKGEIILFMN